MNQNICAVPAIVTTGRLTLGSWTAADAVELLPLLEANWAHLSPWIPAHVATPQPIPELARRLADNEDKFNNNIEWRYAMRLRSSNTLLGEVALFPRSAVGRVALPLADRVEIGYWLRVDFNGAGLVTEAVKALAEIALGWSRFGRVEIRCDPRNTRSVNIPGRLGFVLETTANASTSVYVCQRSART